MGTKRKDGYIFDALDDFTKVKDPAAKLAAAQEFGLRIIETRNLKKAYWRVVEGPFWSFRRRASSLLLGHDDKDRFFIRRMEATEGSNIRLYYHDLKTGQDSIIEFDRIPGLCLTVRSGWRPGVRMDVYTRCTRYHVLRFITDCDCFDVF